MQFVHRSTSILHYFTFLNSLFLLHYTRTPPRIIDLVEWNFLILQCNKTQQTFYLLLHRWPFFVKSISRKLCRFSFKKRPRPPPEKQNRSSDAALEGIIIIRPDSFPFPVLRWWHNTKKYLLISISFKKNLFWNFWCLYTKKYNGFSSCVTQKKSTEKNSLRIRFENRNSIFENFVPKWVLKKLEMSCGPFLSRWDCPFSVHFKNKILKFTKVKKTSK